MTKEESDRLKILCKNAPKVNVVTIVLAVLASVCCLCFVGVFSYLCLTSHKRQVLSEEQVE